MRTDVNAFNFVNQLDICVNGFKYLNKRAYYDFFLLIYKSTYLCICVCVCIIFLLIFTYKHLCTFHCPLHPNQIQTYMYVCVYKVSIDFNTNELIQTSMCMRGYKQTSTNTCTPFFSLFLLRFSFIKKPFITIHVSFLYPFIASFPPLLP